MVRRFERAECRFVHVCQFDALSEHYVVRGKFTSQAHLDGPRLVREIDFLEVRLAVARSSHFNATNLFNGNTSRPWIKRKKLKRKVRNPSGGSNVDGDAKVRSISLPWIYLNAN